MKRLVLLILSVMAFAGMGVAQDVYTSGYYYNQEEDLEVSAVFKNGELLYYNHNASSGYDYASHAVLCLDGDVYWVDNCSEENGGYVYGDVFKNDERWLSNPVTSHSVISTLFTDVEDNVYAAGACDVSGSNLPVVWRNDVSTPYAILDNVQGIIYDAEMFEGYVVACGLRDNGSGPEGVIWRDGPQMTVINLGHLIPYSLTVYEGDIYTIAQDRIANYSVVYRNDTELFTMSFGYYGQSICVDAGDVYAIETSINISEQIYKVWKNGQVILISDGCPYVLEVNSEGIFCVGEKGVAKDAEWLFTTHDNGFYDMFVDLSCRMNAACTLPYFEGFETGETDWTCWSVKDFDNHNDGYSSYWNRGGMYLNVTPASGQHCAWHRFNTNSQSGLLSSPLLDFPTGGNITLTFKTYERYPEDYVYEAVWVGTEGHDDEVWVQTEPSAAWKTVTVDLSAYQGQQVIIAFDYQGQDAHSWYIDDISITQGIGVEENDASSGSFVVYPNPATDRVRIEGLEAGNEVQLFNALGELVKTVKVDADSEIGIDELVPGLYLVRCGNTSLRFVKE